MAFSVRLAVKYVTDKFGIFFSQKWLATLLSIAQALMRRNFYWYKIQHQSQTLMIVRYLYQNRLFYGTGLSGLTEVYVSQTHYNISPTIT